jgi:PBP1b-binding outer membrane lipoprotein LpoB
MKTLLLASVLILAGCATNPEVEKSISRDQTMSNMAKTALINEMLNSPDPHVRSKGAEAATQFINPKKSILPF